MMLLEIKIITIKTCFTACVDISKSSLHFYNLFLIFNLINKPTAIY